MKKYILVLVTIGVISSLLTGCASKKDEIKDESVSVATSVEVSEESAETAEDAIGDSLSNIQWSTAHNGPESNDDRMFGVVELSAGGYVAVGNSENEDESEDAFCAKYNAEGEQVWLQYVSDTHLNAVIETSTGFLCIGSSTVNSESEEEKNQNATAILFDQKGKQVWTTSLDGSGYDTFTGHVYSGSGYPIALSNGHFLILGNTYSTDGVYSGLDMGQGDGFLAELDADGSLLSVKTFGGSGYDSLQDMSIQEDGSLIITGYTNPVIDEKTGEVNPPDGMFEGLDFNGSESFIYISKLDSEYNILWTKLIPAHGPWVLGLAVAKDGGIVLAADGVEEPKEGQATSLYLFKLDAEGNILWNKSYSNDKNDEASIYVTSLEAAKDGTFLLSGEVHYQSVIEEGAEGMRGWLGCINQDGTLVWERNFEGSDYELHIHVGATSDGGAILAAQQASEDGDWDAVLIKYAPYKQ